MIDSKNYEQLLQELKLFLPSERIYTDELRTLAWGTDASFYRLTPRIVIRSDNEKEVSQIVKACYNHHIPFTFRAAGTSLSGQSLSDSVLIVAGKSWEEYHVSADRNTITMQPGLLGGRVNSILKPFGRVLPPDPASVNSAMIGGIVCNNGSGMNCGVHANSDRMLCSARIILADGTLLDTGNEESKKQFRQTHPDFISNIEQLRDDVRSNKTLADRIKKKYSIKNVTGLNLRPLTAYDDPFDIIAHSIVGSEGTLAFLAEVTMKTLHEYPFRATAMVYFHTMVESCHAVVALKQLKAPVQNLEMSAEDLMVKSAEMLDYLSLASVNDPVFLQYKKDVDAGKVEGVAPGDYHNLTAILTETKAMSQEELDHNVSTITDTLKSFNLYQPFSFTDDPEVYGKYWTMRAGIFPTVGGMRPAGTSCLIEDVAFPVEDLPEATVKMQQIIHDHGYDEGCIYGHAFEGNYHFILNQSFKEPEEVTRYSDMMHEIIKLVKSYDGSLKAEHGTGRNMAPFVKYEWGDDAFATMRRLKEIFDPEGLLNPGVIFNDNPDCFIENLKHLPELDYDFSQLPDNKEDALKMQSPMSTTEETIKGVRRANKCIECGFCERNCLTCGLTLSSRTRIATQREISYLKNSGKAGDLERARRLEQLYRYYGEQTCAADGLCATSCPMHINTADLTHLLRQISSNQSKIKYPVGKAGAKHMPECETAVKGLLTAANLAHTVIGTKAMSTICETAHKTGLPLWTPAMPKPNHIDKKQLAGRNTAVDAARKGDDVDQKVVYFPSCLNQTMGLSKDAPVKETVSQEICKVLNRAGYEVIFPDKMNHLCCGQIWESKGMMDIADRKTAELEEALWKASEGGRYPVICDQSPCLHRMRKLITRMKLYEPVEFIIKYVQQHLTFHPVNRTVAVHITCSMREMGLGDELISLAEKCATQVVVPEGVGCCGFAGDKGFNRPEMNKYALRHLKPEITKHHAVVGYSNSRTCEIGLQYHSGIPYMSIVYLVDEATR